MQESYYEQLDAIAEESRRRMSREESLELDSRARALIFAEYASDMSPEVRDHIWSRAWELGHSLGYHEVAIEFSELASWVRRLRELPGM